MTLSNLPLLQFRDSALDALERPIEHFPLNEPYPFDLPWEVAP
jgi:hypothetical protein